MINIAAAFAALTVAGVAAFYSIVGLSTIFAGAFWPVVIMASALEVAKIVTALFVHLRWNELNRAFKAYLSAAVVVLMLITSLGIFGFLSKAHIDSKTTIANNDVAIQLIDSQIKSEQKVIDYVDSQFELLDNAYEQWIAGGYMTRALNERNNQKQDREALSNQQAEAANRLRELTMQRSQLELESVAQQSEIGPIKYVAEIVYGDSSDDRVDDAARILILLLIFAFDPLAILLLLSATSIIYKNNDYIPPIVTEDDINDMREGTNVSVKEINDYIKRKRELFPRQ